MSKRIKLLRKIIQKINKSENKRKEWRWFSLGFIVVIGGIIALYFNFCQNRIDKLENIHREILQVQKDHIAKLDSSFCLFDKKCVERIEFSVNNLLPNLNTEDSALYKKTQFERDSISKLLLIELIQKNNYAEVFAHVPILHNEVSEAGNNIESMIKLHLDRVEHEYTNITIWAAVLTILFLVFSFYSLFRLEELKKEAKENLEEINAKGKSAIDEIENKKQILDSSINAITESTKTIEQRTVEQMTKAINERIEELSKPSIERLNNVIEDYEQYITDLKGNNSQSSTTENTEEVHS